MSILAPENREIAAGLLLIKEPLGISAYEFYLHVSLLQSLEVTSDFSASENIYLEGTSSLKTKSLVHPFSKTKIATVKLLDEWKISTKFQCKVVDPPKALILEAMKKEKAEIKLKLENCKSAFLRIPISLTPMPEIEKILKNNSLPFVDPDFPPVDFLEKVNFAWKRLSSVNPHGLILPEHIEPFDLIQGDGKDFWLKSSFEVLAERPDCIKRLFITKKVNSFGIYRIKLCKNNNWVLVTIDDYIPFLPNGSCLLSTTIDKTSWATLLEKAYCKLLGSYEVINYNILSEILIDFTGCPCFSYTIPGQEIETLWEIISENSDQGYICCLFSDNNENVPVAYIIKTFVLDERGLLQCRNLSEEPKDTKWNKSSKLWTSKYKAKVSPVFDLNNFYLEIDELFEMYNKLIVCKLGNWYEFRHKAEFKRQEDYFCKSDVYYSVVVEEPTQLIINLQQEHELEIGVVHCRNYLDVGLMIFQLNEENELNIVAFKDLLIDRTSIIEVNLEKGSYIILPFTSGCLLQSPAEISPEKMRLFLNNSPNPLFSSTLNDIFAKLDKKDEKVLKFEKFKRLCEKLGKNINEGEFRQKILKKYLAADDGVTLEGFKNFIYDQAKTLPEDIVWEWLENYGYDRDFYSVSSRLFFISFHSDQAISTEIRKNSCGFEDMVFKYLISEKGIDFENNGAVKVKYYFSKEIHCYFYGVVNMKEEGIECTLDCSESENMIFYFKGGRASRFVGPGEIEYVMPALAQPAAESFSKSVRIFY